MPMKIRRKLGTFIRLPWKVKVLFAEAFFTSAWVKVCLKMLPFNKVMQWLGGVQQESTIIADPATLLFRRQVKCALDLCSKYTPWHTECYTLSLTGKLLLKRRNISSTLYIGFNKDDAGKYNGHAWLRANETYISGWANAASFTVHSTYSWSAALDKLTIFPWSIFITLTWCLCPVFNRFARFYFSRRLIKYFSIINLFTNNLLIYRLLFNYWIIYIIKNGLINSKIKKIYNFFCLHFQ